MRTLSVALIVFAASTSGSAQSGRPAPAAPTEVAVQGATDTVMRTKLEALLSARGTVVVQEGYALGNVGPVSVQAIVVSEAGQQEPHLRGLRVDVVDATGRSDPASVSLIDMDEIARLSRALVSMVDLASAWKLVDKPYTEVHYTTKGDFVVGFSQRKQDQSAFISSGPARAATTLADIQALTQLKDMVQTAQGLLQYK